MINDYGWSDALQQAFAPHAANGLIPGRVIVQQRGLFTLATDDGDMVAEPGGRFLHQAENGLYPVAGDWVAAAPRDGRAAIQAVLPRRTAFTRKAAGTGREAQVVAANVDVALLVAALNADFNPRRLERYLATAWQSGAAPVVVLTKADLCDDVEAAVAATEAVAIGVPVLAISATNGVGLEALRAHVRPGQTAALVGSSGAGKSTLVNALAGEERMAVGVIREADARGRHTTTHRELVLLPSGALILDTPGMRELGLLHADDGLSATFEDIEALAETCKFNDCRHGNEPGCAIQTALADGSLDPDRWRSFGKLQKEAAFFDRKEDRAARNAERQKWVTISKAQRAGRKQKEPR